MKLRFTRQGWEDYLDWQATDRGITNRINRLIEDTVRSPTAGIGKPEPLWHTGPDVWSRRITEEHRLVYLVADDAITVYRRATTADRGHPELIPSDALVRSTPQPSPAFERDRWSGPHDGAVRLVERQLHPRRRNRTPGMGSRLFGCQGDEPLGESDRRPFVVRGRQCGRHRPAAHPHAT